MPQDPQDLTGRRFGRWVVRRRATRLRGHAGWLCECDCGTLRAVRTDSLVDGKSRSCGCGHPRYGNAPRPSVLISLVSMLFSMILPDVSYRQELVRVFTSVTHESDPEARSNSVPLRL